MSTHLSSYRLSLTADADSSVLARIGDVLACLGLVPESLDARREAAIAGFTILATLLVSGTARQIDLLVRKLQQTTLVHAVEWERLAPGEGPTGTDESP